MALNAKIFDFQENGHGEFWFRYNMEECLPSSKIVASICEIDPSASTSTPHKGAARLSVHNIVPGHSHVDLWLGIEWDTDVVYRVSLILVY